MKNREKIRQFFQGKDVTEKVQWLLYLRIGLASDCVMKGKDDFGFKEKITQLTAGTYHIQINIYEEDHTTIYPYGKLRELSWFQKLRIRLTKKRILEIG